MAIYYLDADDEITSAAARIRDSSDNRIALVLSNGSRVATSRINFRLLAREARKRNKRLAIVAADPTVQSVVRSAELPVYATVGEYEKAEAVRVAAGGDAGSGAVGDALDELALTVGAGGRQGVPVGRYAKASTGRSGGTGRGIAPSVTGASRSGPPRVPRPVMAGIAALIALIVAGGAFFFLPGATVALTLREDSLGPVTFSVKVDPSVTAANDQTATVPGTKKSFPISAFGTFPATGQKVEETPATGTVTFTSEDTGKDWSIPSGTQLTTPDGIVFVTTTRVVVPNAVFSPPTRGKVDAPVAALKKGLSGNVAANRITKMPDVSGNGLLSVTNVAPTTGGTHTVSPQIQQADIDKAQASLALDLGTNFREALAAPAAAPSGSSVFTESGQLGIASCAPSTDSLVGQEATSFDYHCTATGTAELGDTASIRSVAERRIKTLVKPGYKLVESSIKTEFGKPTSDGSVVVVPVIASGRQVPDVTADQIKAAVKGKSVDDAKAALSKYGAVDIAVSPGWSSSLPSFDFRIDVQIVVPASGASGSPEPVGTRTPAPPARTPARTGESSPSASGSPGETPTPADTPTPDSTTPAPASGEPSASPAAT